MHCSWNRAKLTVNHAVRLQLWVSPNRLSRHKAYAAVILFWQAFDTKHHPLGQLVNGLIDVFRASYVGMGTHRRLLQHAVAEAKSFVIRVYGLVR